MSYAVFGVGIGNFKVRRDRRKEEWIALLNEHLAGGAPPVRIIAHIAPTGSFLADSPLADLEKVATQFDGALGTNWIVHPIERVRAALSDLEKATEPPKENGIRWTGGLAFCGGAGSGGATVTTTPRAVLWTISPHIIGVFKRDIERADGTLDPNQRNGGWGAISGDISRQIGGLWTSRSHSTINRLLRADPVAPTKQ